jgi:hypothetical protein
MEAVMSSADESTPFDETAVTRGRHKCYFCEAHKSDEWKFIARLNAFICKTCHESIERTFGEVRNAR